ncbi:MAG: ATP-dependent DNA helicase RecG [Acidobacteriota bacterium]
MDKLFDPIRYIKGVGPQREKQLNRIGIADTYDLLWHIPRAYVDRSDTMRVADLKVGEVALVFGRIRTVMESTTRRGMKITKALIGDTSGNVTGVWFNQKYVKNLLKPGSMIFVRGKVGYSYGNAELTVSEYEILDPEEEGDNLSITPVYPSTEGVSQKIWRQMTRSVLDNYSGSYPDVVPASLLARLKLMTPRAALKAIHYPASWEELETARKSLALEELYLLQLAVQKERAALNEPDVIGIRNIDKDDLVADVISGLSFSLTGAQSRVLKQINTDMELDKPMNRLVQGDVGAGKTVVAALAMAKAVSAGYQATMMAPTEILATQHYETLHTLYNGRITVVLLTGKTTAKLRASILEGLATGEIDVLVGTHALIEDEVVFNNLSLAVIDEQHRFGVRQRSILSRKGQWPDILVMSATPIPRTLALTIYGDLDIATIDELPPGRKPIKTLFVRETARAKAYSFFLDQVKQGRQGYIVCPLVEESEKQDLINATSLSDQLQNSIFKDYKVGLMHGRMKPSEKTAVMDAFRQNQIHVLVSTTVIEVGVDVANATVMVVEEAERFGLSQLHQLRGRVGRGAEQSYCCLIGNPKTDEGFQRLKVMERTNDGFEIANEDMRLRGPGDLWGLKQHGLPPFKVADLFKDAELLEVSKKEAESFWSKNTRVHPLIDKFIVKKMAKDDDIVSN